MASETLHATAISLNEKGCLIVGAPGAGKSLLALELIAQGAELIADDRVVVCQSAETLAISAPTELALIEARGVGLLRLGKIAGPQPLSLIVDLDRPSNARLPHLQSRDLLGVAVPVIFGKDVSGLSAILTVLLKGAELLDPDG